MTYEIQITDCPPAPRTTRTFVDTSAEAWELARAAQSLDRCVLLVGWSGENVSWGDFHIWLADDRAFVRLDEHRDWYASDPAMGAAAGDADAELWDYDGPFFEPRSRTVSRTQAFAALEHWLCTGKMLPSLTWT